MHGLASEMCGSAHVASIICALQYVGHNLQAQRGGHMQSCTLGSTWRGSLFPDGGRTISDWDTEQGSYVARVWNVGGHNAQEGLA